MMKKLTFILAVFFTLALGACTDNQQRERANDTDMQSNEMEEDMNQNDQNDLEGGEWEETEETDTTQNNPGQENTDPGL